MSNRVEEWQGENRTMILFIVSQFDHNWCLGYSHTVQLVKQFKAVMYMQFMISRNTLISSEIIILILYCIIQSYDCQNKAIILKTKIYWNIS